MTKARDLANAGTALTSVSATELGYLDGVTSAVQTQLNAKQAVVSGVDSTEIGYLDGVTSSIQTQLNSKIGQATAINPTIVDAKGDIIAATAADTVARLAVGANDTVLTADSSTATGLKWASTSSTPTFVGCQLYMSASQSIANSTNTTLLWGAEYFDSNGFHSTTTNTGRITIPTGKAGYYLLTGAVRWNGNTSQRRNMSLAKNGTYIAGTDWMENPSTNEGFLIQTFAFIVNAAVADYYVINVSQGSGGAIDVVADSSYFGAIYLGA